MPATRWTSKGWQLALGLVAGLGLVIGWIAWTVIYGRAPETGPMPDPREAMRAERERLDLSRAMQNVEEARVDVQGTMDLQDDQERNRALTNMLRGR